MNLNKLLSGKKVLVTGASGFIGTRLCEALLEKNAEVHGIYNLSTDSTKDLNIHWRQCDLSDFKATKTILNEVKPDIIFHLASHVAGNRNIKLVLPTFKGNLASTVNLLTVSTEIGCKKIVISGSMEEPDSNKNENKVPSSPYAASKWASSYYARMFHALYNTPVTIARLFMVYGPGQKDLSKLIPYTILTLNKNEAPNFTSGSRQIDWIYIDDVVNGLLTISCTPNLEGQTIDLGTGVTFSIKKIVNQIISTMQSHIKPNFGSLQDRPMENSPVANIKDTFSKINWKPNTPLAKGIQQTIKWYNYLSVYICLCLSI